jgi:hypothetical protein
MTISPIGGDRLGALLEDFKRAYEQGDAPDPLGFAEEAPDELYEPLLECLDAYLETAPLVRPAPRAQERATGRRLLLSAREADGEVRRALAARALLCAESAGDAAIVAEARGLLEADPLRALVERWRAAAASGAQAIRACARALLAQGACRLDLRPQDLRGGAHTHTWRFVQGGKARLEPDGTLRISYLDVTGALGGQALLVLPAAAGDDPPRVQWSAETLVPGLTRAANEGGRVTATIGRLPAADDRSAQATRLLGGSLLVAV